MGGAEKNFVALFNGLSAKGYNCSIVCLRPISSSNSSLAKDLSDKIKVVELPGYSITRLISLIKDLRQSLSTLNPDCIVSFMDQSNIIALLALPREKKPAVIVCERNNPARNKILSSGLPSIFQIPARLLRNHIYKKANYICCQTEGASRYFRRYVPRVETITIPNFVTPALNPTPMKERLPVIVSVARLVPEKGLDQLIRAFFSISEKHKNWRLEIYGDGPEKGKLEQLVQELRAQRKIKLRGKSDKIDEILNQAAVFVLNSRFEGFPNALLEAMATGCAAIASDCDFGPSDIIEHNVNALLIKPNNIEALTEELERLLTFEELRVQLSEQAPKVGAKFSLDRYLTLFEETVLLASRHL